MLTIESLQNPRIKAVVKLRDRRDRDREGKYIIEGYREILRAKEYGVPLSEIFFCPDYWLGGNEESLVQRLVADGAFAIKTTTPVFDKIAYRDRPEGLLAVAKQQRLGLDNLTFSNPAFFLVAEAIEKPGNLGTMLRSADAVGVDSLIVCNRCTDIYNPNVVRASTGALFSVPVVETENEALLSWLKERKIAILAATPHAEKIYTQVDMTAPIAIAVGAEQYGLSDVWMNNADIQVRIPMARMADSLNVATAATILLYEVARQRGFPKEGL